MRAFSESVDESDYIEIILSPNDVERMERGILVCGIVEIDSKVYNVAVRAATFPFSGGNKAGFKS